MAADGEPVLAPLRRPRAVSAAHGPLRHLLLSYTDRVARRRSARTGYAGLLAELPERTRLTILASPGLAPDLQELLAAACPRRRVTIVVAPDGVELSAWARDPFIGVRDLGRADPVTCLLQPFNFKREGDAAMAGVLARATSLQARRCDLCFQGASVLAADDFVLLGRDCLDETVANLEELWGISAPEGADPVEYGASLFQQAFDPAREVVPVGTDLEVPGERMRPVETERGELLEVFHEANGAAQPLAHLDMFVTLAGRDDTGRYRVLVGSPAEADRVLGRDTVEHSMAPLFDDVASGLSRHGFEVTRNPLPLTYADGRRRVDGVAREVRRWYFASANNCLVQIDEAEGNQVWVPTYGHGPWRELGATDEANARIWSELGFTVHELGSFHAFAQDQGSVRCLTQCLER